jgi:hypothetical protein
MSLPAVGVFPAVVTCVLDYIMIYEIIQNNDDVAC